MNETSSLWKLSAKYGITYIPLLPKNIKWDKDYRLLESFEFFKPSLELSTSFLLCSYLRNNEYYERCKHICNLESDYEHFYLLFKNRQLIGFGGTANETTTCELLQKEEDYIGKLCFLLITSHYYVVKGSRINRERNYFTNFDEPQKEDPVIQKLEFGIKILGVDFVFGDPNSIFDCNWSLPGASSSAVCGNPVGYGKRYFAKMMRGNWPFELVGNSNTIDAYISQFFVPIASQYTPFLQRSVGFLEYPGYPWFNGVYNTEEHKDPKIVEQLKQFVQVTGDTTSTLDRMKKDGNYYHSTYISLIESMKSPQVFKSVLSDLFVAGELQAALELELKKPDPKKSKNELNMDIEKCESMRTTLKVTIASYLFSYTHLIFVLSMFKFKHNDMHQHNFMKQEIGEWRVGQTRVDIFGKSFYIDNSNIVKCIDFDKAQITDTLINIVRYNNCYADTSAFFDPTLCNGSTAYSDFYSLVTGLFKGAGGDLKINGNEKDKEFFE
jgi:hypothetical protein